MSARDDAGPALCEPWPVEEIRISGRIVEECGSFIRMTFYREERLAGSDQVERIVKARLIMEKTDYQTMVRNAIPTIRHMLCAGAEAGSLPN